MTLQREAHAPPLRCIPTFETSAAIELHDDCRSVARVMSAESCSGVHQHNYKSVHTNSGCLGSFFTFASKRLPAAKGANELAVGGERVQSCLLFGAGGLLVGAGE